MLAGRKAVPHTVVAHIDHRVAAHTVAVALVRRLVRIAAEAVYIGLAAAEFARSRVAPVAGADWDRCT